MAEPNEVVSTENNPQGGMTEDYLAVIKEMKQNSVSKEEYEKLREENRNLLQSLVEGKQIDPEETEEKIDVSKLCKEIVDPDVQDSNLSGWTKILQVRKGILDEGGEDIFIPKGKFYTPSAEMNEAAERVASVIQECIDYSEGDSELFTNELMRRTRDIKL